MTTTKYLRRLGVIVATACTVAMGLPLANAQMLPGGVQHNFPQSIPEVLNQNTAAVERALRDVEAVKEQLEGAFLQPLTQIQPQLVTDYGGVSPDEVTTLPVFPEPLPYEDPNYQWRTDSVSKVLAAKPLAGEVLHRVPGSFHDAPRIPHEAEQAQNEDNVSLYGPGTPIYVGQNMCTVAVAGYDDAGRKIALTSGHCGEPGTNVFSADSPGVGASGTVVSSNSDLDYSVIELGSNAEVSRTYNGTTINALGGKPRRPGQVVCKTGVASGYTCGATFHDWEHENISQVCAMPGDSGAPLMAGDRLVGMVAGGIAPPELNLPCYSPLQGAVHAPTRSLRMDSVITALELTEGPGRGFSLPEN
ncbi:S1 family peptidase [Corynebacterium mayonis]|uniref:S1 family peptidase n=1 Tax=Corynebacterium mayonis TaxID=3062461 RepID=UPI00314052FB